MHELATNAVKHGALSKLGGRLRLTWTIEETVGKRYLQLGWQELGGPVDRSACVQGFGMKLISFTGAELGGGVNLDFRPQGLEAKITVQIG